MLPLKKKAEAASTMPPWHPDLRIVERMPDTKVVRTAFFVNGVAILVAVVLALYLITDRWELRSINNQIADTQKQIDHDKFESAKAVALFAKFKTEQAKIDEITKFTTARPVASKLYLKIAGSLPAKIALTSYNVSLAGLSIKGIIRGAPDQASGDASAYLDQLRRDKELMDIFSDASLNSLSRDEKTGRLAIEVFLKFKEVKKP